MHPSRNSCKPALLTLLWALSLVALCLPCAANAPVAPDMEWTRTLPDTGAWLLAMLALGFAYRAAGRIPRIFAQVGLWLLSAVLSAVVTLGYSFATVDTAQLVTAQPWLSLLRFAGLVPTCYLGFALLINALRSTPANRTSGPDASAPRHTEAEGLFAAPQAGDDAAGLPRPVGPLGRDVWYASPPSVTTAGSALFAAPQTDRYVPEGDTAALDTLPADVAAPSATPPNARRTRTAPRWWDGRMPRQRAHGMTTLSYTLLLLLCWLPYLLILWPGTVSNDSITQLAEALGRRALSNGNPVFQTGLIWLAVQLGQTLMGSADAAVALYTLTQGVLMAWLMGYTLNRIRRAHTPAWLAWLAAAFFALCPVFPTFAFCMGKDTNFAMAVLWLMLMVWRVLESRWPPLRTLVGLILSSVLCVLLRNAGIGIAMATLGLLLVWALTVRTRQWRAPLAALAVTAAVAMVLHLSVLPALGAQPTPETENWSLPLQQVARVVANEEATPEERAAIDEAMPVDEIKAAYKGELSDPVKALWRESTTDAQRNAFFATWLRLGFKHPATYLSATFHNTYGYLLPGYVNTSKPTLLMGMEGRTTAIDGAFDFTVNPWANSMRVTLKTLYAFAPFRLLTSPGLFAWVLLMAIVGALHCRQRRYVVAMLPALIVLAGCLLSAVNGYVRYALPLYFAAPVLLALLSQGLRGGVRGRRG